MLASTNAALAGTYQIRLTVTLDDYSSVQTTTDFTVNLIYLGSGPSYVAAKSVKVGSS